MAAISISRRAAAGIAFIVAGALLLLLVILPLLTVNIPFLGALAYAALTVGFVILALGAVNSTVAKIALFAAAVGWAILTLAGLGIGLPGILLTIAAILAGVGGLIGAIVLYVGKEISNTSALLFIVATILGLLLLLPTMGVSALAGAATILTVLFGIALIATGFYFRQKERGRR